jgi:hypothetical protein
LTGSLLDHFREFRFATDRPAFSHAWRVYLAGLYFPEEVTAGHFLVRQASLRLALTGQTIPFLSIAEMALILLRMRCSEAEVERGFTLLRPLFGDHARHSRGDLVESRLTIMMNNLDVTPDFMRSLSQMEQEVLGAPPRH